MSDTVPAFLDAARAFRSTLATEEPLERDELARRLRNAVARVYVAAARLPRGGAATTERTSGSISVRRSSQALEDRLTSAFDERALAQELVAIDVGLADSLVWLEERPTADALRHVWLTFEQRWGSHAVDVLRPLHHIARGGVG
jgi:hypothetical protein